MDHEYLTKEKRISDGIYKELVELKGTRRKRYAENHNIQNL